MISMSGQRLERPPTSGPGSGVAAWREYAAAVTGTDVASWGELSREDIIELLDGDEPTTVKFEHEQSPPRRRPEWMVPTADGMVPESQLPRR